MSNRPVTIYLVRHAAAGSRRKWKGDDRLRPLSPEGTWQAAALARQIRTVDRLLSSPFVRCRETLEPLAEATGRPIELVDSLGEGGSAATTMAMIDELASNGEDAVICTHGDVTSELIWLLDQSGVPLPEKQGNAKGSMWTITIDNGEIRAATYTPPPGKAAKAAVR